MDPGKLWEHYCETEWSLELAYSFHSARYSTSDEAIFLKPPLKSS